MSKQNVTVTSKNQITIPSMYVKKLRLTKNRVLNAELRAGKIILTPEPDIKSLLSPFWGKHHASKPLNETELKRAIQKTVAEKALKK